MIGLGAPASLDLLGWLAALACGGLAGWLWLREGRRRGALNQALHELRRPLQVLALMATAGPSRRSPATVVRRLAETSRSRSESPSRLSPSGRLDAGAGRAAEPSLDVLEQALGAVADLDRAVNGEKAPGAAEVVSIREPIERLVLRWRALLDPAELRLCWVAGDVHVLVDPVRLRQVLENLIVNAREHGRSPITVAVSTAPVGVRIAVGDAGPASGVGPHPTRSGRRGHGLTVAAEFAAAHGGVLSSWQRRDGGTVVAIDLPLVSSLHPARPFAHRCTPGAGGAPVAGEAQAPAPAAAHIP